MPIWSPGRHIPTQKYQSAPRALTLPSSQRPPSIALCSLTFFSKRSCRFETLSSKLHTFRTEHCCWLVELPSVPYTFNSNKVHTIKEVKCSMFRETIFVSNSLAWQVPFYISITLTTATHNNPIRYVLSLSKVDVPIRNMF